MRIFLTLITAFLGVGQLAVYAHCPLCTAAVGTGLLVTRLYGVDDTVVGVWIGAFIVSTALWFGRLIERRYRRLPLHDFTLIMLGLVLTLLPFYFTGLINMQNRLLGLNKLLLGILVGCFVAYSGIFISGKIKEKRGKVLFPFQTIAITLASLILVSFVFWYFVKPT
jgi:uncharacterized protein YacL